jgi:hypothetical protein
VLEDWRARLILAELRKVILVASQFFEFLHGLGHSATWRHVRLISVLAPNNGHTKSPPFAAQRPNESSKLDGFLRSRAVPIISIFHSLRRTTASAVHSADATAAPQATCSVALTALT